MGAYIQLEGTTENKMDWIVENGWIKGHGIKPLKNLEEIHDAEGVHNRRLLCLVNNGAFVAIAVASNKKEINVFNEEDGRFKVWFTLDLATIREKMTRDDWKRYRDEIRKG